MSRLLTHSEMQPPRGSYRVAYWVRYEDRTECLFDDDFSQLSEAKARASAIAETGNRAAVYGYQGQAVALRNARLGLVTKPIYVAAEPGARDTRSVSVTHLAGLGTVKASGSYKRGK